MISKPIELVVAVIFRTVENQKFVCLEKTGVDTGNIGFVLPEGPLTEGEMIHQTAAKIVKEQTGAEAVVSRLGGSVYFTKPNETPKRVYIFIVWEIHGDIGISEKFIPEWHDILAIPYDKMEKAYLTWLPSILSGWGVDARFEYNIDGTIKNGSVNRRYL